MPDLFTTDHCDDCAEPYANRYRWNHACDERNERWLCLHCYEAAEVYVGHIEDTELAGTLEEDPWPLEPSEVPAMFGSVAPRRRDDAPEAEAGR